MKRVLVVVDSLLAGGAERVAVELACGLDRSRYIPHVLVTRCDGPLRLSLEAAGVEFTILNRAKRFDRAAWRLAKQLARECDIIHSHKFGSNVWSALLARRTRKPMIAHEHNFAAVSSRSRRLLDRFWIAPAAQKIVCVSSSVADTVRSHNVSAAKIVVVENGVRTQAAWPRAASRQELGLSESDFVVGITAVLRPEKAHEVLLDAAALMIHNGKKLRLCIVGDGPRRAQLKAHAESLSIGADITWAGERQDAARFASAFDVAVLCSHWEGLPLSALEAMAAGVPLVATAVGGLPDLLSGDAGIVVSAGDSKALAEAIGQLQSQPAIAQRMGAAGMQRVRDQYSFRTMTNRVQSLYDEALSLTAEDVAESREVA